MPSSRFLVNRLLRGVDFAEATVIVELGVGTGCVTREILRRMRPDARLVSLEINPTFIEEARKKILDPRLTLRYACATTLPQILDEEGIDGVDAVVSSLPLAIMDDDVVDRILDVSRDSLLPDGRYLQYQYSLTNRHGLSRRYRNVAVSFTLLNVPPAFVYKCSQRTAAVTQRARARPSLGALYAAALSVAALVGRVFHEG